MRTYFSLYYLFSFILISLFPILQSTPVEIGHSLCFPKFSNYLICILTSQATTETNQEHSFAINPPDWSNLFTCGEVDVLHSVTQRQTRTIEVHLKCQILSYIYQIFGSP